VKLFWHCCIQDKKINTKKSIVYIRFFLILKENGKDQRKKGKDALA